MTDENTPNGSNATGAAAAGGESKSNSGTSSNGGGPRKGQRLGGPSYKGAVNGTNRYPKFVGRCEELKDYVYDLVGSRSADSYTKTTKEVAEYVGSHYSNGGDARLAVMHLKMPSLEKPKAPPKDADATDMKIWEEEVKEFVKTKIKLKENVKQLYSLVWGQCSEAMRAKLESMDGHRKLSEEGDGIGLLKQIKSIVYNFQDQKYLPLALYEANRRLYACTQGKHTPQEYQTQFLNTVDVIEHCGGRIGAEPGIVAAIAAEKEYGDVLTLGKDALLARDERPVSHVGSGQGPGCEVVGGRILWRPQGHEGAHRWCYVPW